MSTSGRVVARFYFNESPGSSQWTRVNGNGFGGREVSVNLVTVICYLLNRQKGSMPVHLLHYSDVIMSPMASHITSLTIVNSTNYSAADQRKHQSSASLAFVRGIHRWPVNSPSQRPVTWKMFPFDDVIIIYFHPMSVWPGDVHATNWVYLTLSICDCMLMTWPQTVNTALNNHILSDDNTRQTH